MNFSQERQLDIMIIYNFLMIFLAGFQVVASCKQRVSQQKGRCQLRKLLRRSWKGRISVKEYWLVPPSRPLARVPKFRIQCYAFQLIPVQISKTPQSELWKLPNAIKTSASTSASQFQKLRRANCENSARRLKPLQVNFKIEEHELMTA